MEELSALVDEAASKNVHNPNEQDDSGILRALVRLASCSQEPFPAEHDTWGEDVPAPRTRRNSGGRRRSVRKKDRFRKLQLPAPPERRGATPSDRPEDIPPPPRPPPAHTMPNPHHVGTPALYPTSRLRLPKRAGGSVVEIQVASPPPSLPSSPLIPADVFQKLLEQRAKSPEVARSAQERERQMQLEFVVTACLVIVVHAAEVYGHQGGCNFVNVDTQLGAPTPGGSSFLVIPLPPKVMIRQRQLLKKRIEKQVLQQTLLAMDEPQSDDETTTPPLSPRTLLPSSNTTRTSLRQSLGQIRISGVSQGWKTEHISRRDEQSPASPLLDASQIKGTPTRQISHPPYVDRFLSWRSRAEVELLQDNIFSIAPPKAKTERNKAKSSTTQYSVGELMAKASRDLLPFEMREVYRRQELEADPLPDEPPTPQRTVGLPMSAFASHSIEFPHSKALMSLQPNQTTQTIPLP